MSTSTEITRLTTARNSIRTKLVELGVSTSTAKLDTLATAITAMENRGAVTVEVKEGETYTIPKGYHNGSGTVSGVAGGGNYSLQSKTVTPTKSQQNIVPDAGNYGLSDVTVAAIPENYQDVSSVDAAAADVLSGKKIVLPDGELVAGTMPANGNVSKTLTIATPEYVIPIGYHAGSGSVKIVGEAKSVTPTEAEQEITASAGKVLSGVTVAAIPENYITTDDATATKDQILDGATAYVNGELVEGTMANNGAVSKTLAVGAVKYTVPEGYHDGTGVVQIVTETKNVTPTKSVQSITPTSGKVLTNVTVTAIPDEYQDVSGVTAEAAHVLDGFYFVASDGTLTEGTMANNNVLALSMTGLDETSSSVTIPVGFVAGGTVSLTSDIEEQLAAI